LTKATGKSKGFASLKCPKTGEAKIAIGKLNNIELDGSKIRVKKAEQTPADSDKKDGSGGA